MITGSSLSLFFDLEYDDCGLSFSTLPDAHLTDQMGWSALITSLKGWLRRSKCCSLPASVGLAVTGFGSFSPSWCCVTIATTHSISLPDVGPTREKKPESLSFDARRDFEKLHLITQGLKRNA